MIGVGVIGYGYWGPNLVRNFSEAPGSRIVCVSDLCPERLFKVQVRYPEVKRAKEHIDLITDPDIDAVVIATPVRTHFDLAMQALKCDKHVLVGKPLTATSEQATRLIDEANRRNLVLMVDHTFIYTGAVRKIRELVTTDELGNMYYYDSVRINLGLFQHDVNVIWDLAVHDLSILDYLFMPQPIAVSAIGANHVPDQPDDIAYLTLIFEDSFIAHIHVNWLAPVKVRRTLIGGERKMIVYDDLEISEKVKVYDKGIAVSNNSANIYDVLVDYRTGDMRAPQLDRTEALSREAVHFIKCIERSEKPLTDGESGLRVVRILEAATKSLLKQGHPIELRQQGS